MATIRTLLDEETLEAVRDAVADCAEVEMTVDQVVGLLTFYGEVANEIAEWGVRDTEVRGKIADMVSHHFIAKRWPTYGDKSDVAAFVADIREAAVLRGYAVTPADEEDEDGDDA